MEDHAAGAAISHLLLPLQAASHLPIVLLDALTRPARGSASALRRAPGRRRRSFMMDPPAKMAAMHAAEQIRPSAQVLEAQLLAGCKRGRAVFKAPRGGTAGWLRLSPACPTGPLRRRLARPLHLSSGRGSADRTLRILGQPAPPPNAVRWAAEGCWRAYPAIAGYS